MTAERDFTTLRVERQGPVMMATLNRPQAGNAINVVMARELLAASIIAACDTEIRAVLLCSDGKTFCAGGDLGAFAKAGQDVSSLISEEAALFHAAIARLARMNKPLVTAVQGFAAGAGLSLALLGDIVIAGEEAQFTLAYTAIGMTPDGGASWLLPRLVGLRKAQHLILTNAHLSAQQALDIGLVTKVVPDTELNRAAQEQARELAEGPTQAFARTRALLLSAYEESLETHLDHEARSIVASVAGEDGREGIAAFLGKRPPAFGGRS
ncbi:enoyl-CoA hydratase [Altererythrobacter salegens]|uniref:Enoyl-CoA hydratase n=1 Tax=Croceibacterium salegens TaxID=1737568 RepID=A0A6I4T0A4_9SPHN|nr:enoyl-CoA hydratase-related protein [Croceibacterium salegens]MXO60626.1 enoyl-CoA hydratase [Croceibacterium salegens]